MRRSSRVLLRNLPIHAPLLVAVACAYLLSITSEYRHSRARSRYSVYSNPPLANISKPMINILMLGHFGIYENFASIWLMQTLLDERKGQDPEPMIEAIRSVIRLHPKLETIYMLSCTIILQDFKKPEYCQEIILEGLKAFPRSWRLPMTQGYVEYFLLKRPAQAASFFMMAASRPDSPEYVERTVKKLLNDSSISIEDLQQSLNLLENAQEHSAFLQILKSLGKVND